MENVITRTSQQFGSIRTIEGKPQLWCGTDVARALGYSNPQKAIRDHCKTGTERNVQHPQNPKKTLAMKFIPEADVYRLICHSKLPKAQEFERWVFEDVVPEAVHELDGDSEYFDKTYNGQPVITIPDAAAFTGLCKSRIEELIRTDRFIHGTDYYRLEGRTLAAFKAENPKYHKHVPCVNVITKSGYDKIAAELGTGGGTPKLFTEPESIKEPQYTPSDGMVSLLGYIDRQMILIAEYRRRLLSPCTLAEAERHRKRLALELANLKGFYTDVSTIIMK